MRISVVSVLLVLAVSLMPLTAQAGTNISAFTCSQNLPCNGADPAFPSTPNLIAQVESCLRRNVATAPGADLIDRTIGLGSDGCFTSNPAGFVTGGAVQTSTQCCVKSRGGDQCAVQCTVQVQ
jgi:hypothetical protein